MSLQTGRREYPHHSPAQIRGYLADAAQLVEELEIPEDLRAPAFVQAVTLLAAKQIMFEQQAMSPLLLGRDGPLA